MEWGRESGVKGKGERERGSSMFFSAMVGEGEKERERLMTDRETQWSLSRGLQRPQTQTNSIHS